MGREKSETQKERKSLDNQLHIHQTNTREEEIITQVKKKKQVIFGKNSRLMQS
jgi:hypothetical protein